MILADPPVISRWSFSARCVVMFDTELVQVLMEALVMFQQLVIGTAVEANHRVWSALSKRVGLART